MMTRRVETRGVRKGLTPALVLGEAFAIIDGSGPAALTMRALAARLGVAPMAIYNHFADREAILDALAAGVFASLSVKAPGRTQAGSGWRPRLRGILLAAQRFANRHPHLYRIAMTRPNKPESAFDITTESLAILREAGLTEREATSAYHAFVLMLQGYPLWKDGYERHEEALRCGSGLDAEAQFETSIDWLLKLIALTARRKAPAKGRGQSHMRN